MNKIIKQIPKDIIKLMIVLIFVYILYEFKIENVAVYFCFGAYLLTDGLIGIG